MKRGDIVTVVLPANLGKPRPALVVQSDLFASLPTVTVIPMTSKLVDAPYFRLGIDPAATPGLRTPSHLMVDKISTVSRKRVGRIVGRLDHKSLRRVNRAVALFTGMT